MQLQQSFNPNTLNNKLQEINLESALAGKLIRYALVIIWITTLAAVVADFYYSYTSINSVQNDLLAELIGNTNSLKNQIG